MDYKIKIALDAMGGDNAPEEIVKGAVNAVKERDDIHITLVGQESAVEAQLQQYDYNKSQISVLDAPQVIETAEPPVKAIRGKKDSSLVKAINLVKDGNADAIVSAGSTGAVLVGGQVMIGKLKGIERAPLATFLPVETGGVSLLIDCGANVDAKPSNLVQFARIGSIYVKHVLGIENPRVAIVNIGAEEEKGNKLVKETFPLLKECSDINFTGSIEARDIPAGAADVIVCEAFVANVILKLYEGVAKTMMSIIKKGLTSTPISTIGAALAKSSLKKVLKTFDATEYGGAPLLGLNGLVVKVHGNATAAEIKNAVLQCIVFKEQNINEHIRRCINGEEVPETETIKETETAETIEKAETVETDKEAEIAKPEETTEVTGEKTDE